MLSRAAKKFKKRIFLTDHEIFELLIKHYLHSLQLTHDG